MGGVWMVLWADILSRLVSEKSEWPNSKPIRVLGIDLGTTNCAVADLRWDPGCQLMPDIRCLEIQQDMLTGLYTHWLVPSVVALYWKTEDLAKAVYQRMGRFDPDDYEMMSVESGTPHERRYKNLNAAKTQSHKEGLIEQVTHGYWRIKR